MINLIQVHEEEDESLSSGGHISLQVKRSTFFLDVSSVVGIAMGLVSFLILITGKQVDQYIAVIS